MLSYMNGNRKVVIDPQSGYKARLARPECLHEPYRPLRPENIDLNLSYYCDRGCSFCYLNASPKGRMVGAGDVIEKLERLGLGDLIGLEVAMNINTLREADIRLYETLSAWMRERGLVPNFTVNHRTLLEHDGSVWERIRPMWVGISVTDIDDIEKTLEWTERQKADVFAKERFVFHIINGVFPKSQFERLKRLRPLRFLILGYKTIGRGARHKPSTFIPLDAIMDMSRHHVISFDNLMVEQSGILSQEGWENVYLGEDGQHSFYIDLVDECYAPSSTQLYRKKPIGKMNVLEMFNEVCKGDRHG